MASRCTSAATAGLLGVLLLTGCGESEGKAQEEADGDADASVVPSDPSLVVERADRARVRGAEDAPIRLVEISDFECPFCAQFYRETYPALDSLYIAPGVVRYVWIAFPNPQHPYAWPAIEASYCAGAVGQFWSMHDLLFERQEEWSEAERPAERFRDYAAELDIDAPSFAACIENDRVAPLMVRDYQNAIGAGINSTPFFILADSVAIRGAAPLENFQQAIEEIQAAREASAEASGEGESGGPAAGGGEPGDGASGSGESDAG